MKATRQVKSRLASLKPEVSIAQPCLCRKCGVNVCHPPLCKWYHHWCRLCWKIKGQKYYIKYKQFYVKRYKKNKEKIKAYSKNRYHTSEYAQRMSKVYAQRHRKKYGEAYKEYMRYYMRSYNRRLRYEETRI